MRSYDIPQICEPALHCRVNNPIIRKKTNLPRLEQMQRYMSGFCQHISGRETRHMSLHLLHDRVTGQFFMRTFRLFLGQSYTGFMAESSEFDKALCALSSNNLVNKRSRR